MCAAASPTRVEIREFEPESIPESCTFLVIGPPGSGKCEAAGTQLLMCDGSAKAIENIRPGDLLVGDDGFSRTVGPITTGEDEMFEVAPVDTRTAEPYIVNRSHILTVLVDGEPTDIPIEKLIETPVEFWTRVRGYQIPVPFLEQEVPIDVIAYGTWIRTGIPPLHVSVRNILRVAPSGKVQMLHPAYISNSYANRTALLAAITDCPEIGSKHTMIELNGRTLITDVARLSRTIGIPTSINFFGADRALLIFSPSTGINTYMIRITPKGRGRYFGFTLDGNGRYLHADCSVTHNTTLMENIAYANRSRYPVARAFIGTEDNYDRFCRIFTPLFVSNTYSEEDEKKVIRRQRTLKFEKHPFGSSINIIDDVFDSAKDFRSDTIRNLFKVGSRHYNQLLLFGTQYAVDFDPAVRTSASYVALGRNPDVSQRKTLYENFGGVCGTFAEFGEMMDALTGDYHFMIINKRATTNRREDCISWYKTRVLPEWKFGSKEFRKWSRDRYDPSYTEEVPL